MRGKLFRKSMTLNKLSAAFDLSCDGIRKTYGGDGVSEIKLDI